MSINLKKGQKVSLSKEAAGLSKVIVGLGWDEVNRGGLFSTRKPDPIDCDASAILLKSGKFCSRDDLVYYGNLHHKSGAINHLGDNLTGEGEGDDEQIIIDLAKVPQEYDKIVIVVNIYQANIRKQHFGMLKNAFVRVVDERTGRELCRYDLTENYDGMTAMIFGEVYRYGNEWKFNAIGQGTEDSKITEVTVRFR